MIDWLPPHWGEFSLYALLVGAPMGLVLSFWRHKVKQHKAENIEKVLPPSLPSGISLLQWALRLRIAATADPVHV